MPKDIERNLRKTARKRGYGKKRANAYVFGTLISLGWRPRKRRRKG